MSLQILPPLSSQEVTLGGFLIPRITVEEVASTGQWNVIYDGRFCVLAEDLAELSRWLPFIASVQAVADGYSCHGENSVYRPNPHRTKVSRIDATTGTRED